MSFMQSRPLADVKNYPFLTSDEFGNICTNFASICQVANDWNNHNGEWSSISHMTQSGTDSIRITRCGNPSERLVAINGQAKPSPWATADEDDEIEQIDEEELVPMPPESNCREGAEAENDALTATYDIVLSPSYSVPVLHFSVRTARGKLVTELDTIYDHLVPRLFKNQVLGVGIMGGISTTDHPITGAPSFFIHPCNTADALRQVAADREVRLHEYLFLWMGIITGCVGLYAPVRGLVNEDVVKQ